MKKVLNNIIILKYSLNIWFQRSVAQLNTCTHTHTTKADGLEAKKRLNDADY